MQSSQNKALTSCSLWSAHHLWAATSWNQLWQIHILLSSKLTKHPKRSSCVWWNFPVDGGGAVTDWLTELVSSCWAWWGNSQKSPGRHDGDQNLKSWRSETRFQGIHLRPGNKLMLMLLASCKQALLTVICVFFSSIKCNPTSLLLRWVSKSVKLCWHEQFSSLKNSDWNWKMP